MKRKATIFSLTLLLIWSSCLIAGDYIYRPIKVPDAIGTLTSGINDLGDVVGVYRDCDFCNEHAFLYSDGQYFDMGVDGFTHMTPLGINKHGVITGTITPVNGNQLGFIMDEANTTILDGAIRAEGINNNPDTVVVGYRSTPQFEQAAFIWRAGKYMALINPDLPGLLGSAATGINDKGDIVGYWFTDVDGINVNVQGFVIKSGKLTVIADFMPFGINSEGVMVGYTGAGNDGAVWRDGVIELVQYPGASDTQVNGINNRGVLVGTFMQAGRPVGFTATPFGKMNADMKSIAKELMAGK